MDRKARVALALLATLTATAAGAQVRLPRLPVIVPLGQGQPGPAYPGPSVPGASLQAALLAAAGSDTVFFSRRGWALDPNAIAVLTGQARWLVANPFATVRLEGHGDVHDTRDYALAIGDRRANAVRDFLVLQGVAPHRITVLSWGKERPGRVRVGPSVVTVGPRVVTVVQ